MPLAARRDRRDGPGRTRRTGHTRRDRESPGTLCGVCGAPGARRRLSLGLRALSAAASVAPSEALSRRLLDAFAERQLAQPAVARGAGRTGNGWLRAAAAMLVAAGGCCSGRVRGTSRRVTSRATVQLPWPKFARRRHAAALPCSRRQTSQRGNATARASQHLDARVNGRFPQWCDRSVLWPCRCGGLARFRERRDRPYRDPADIVANLRNRDSARRTGLTCRGRFASGAGWPGRAIRLVTTSASR